MSAGRTDTHLYPAKSAKTPLIVIANLIRGALIGMAELVPGISGGTVALVLGVYERALHNGNLLIDLIKSAIKDRSAIKATMKNIDWWFLIAIGCGMVVAVFSMSTLLHDFVENHAEIARGLFMGMVAVSILVPVGMMDLGEVRRRLPLVIPLFLAAAVISFFGTGLTSAPREDPSLILIFVAAAIAVCALVMPGISGSFFLMAMGLYAPVMASLSNRELDVIAIFMLGAITGVILFVRLLSYVLENHRTITLTIMAGLMLGSLRALWPWQDSDANLLSPHGHVGMVVGMIALGAIVVGAVMLGERIIPKSTGSETISSKDPI